jgi:putative oxidoreductase
MQRSLVMLSFEKYSAQSALVGRLFLSSVFLLFGYAKISAFAGTMEYMSSLGVPAPFAIIVEIGGGLLILTGWQTRPVALGLAIYTLATDFIGQPQLAVLNQFQYFTKNMAIVGGLVAFAAGASSLDARQTRALKQVRSL